MIFDIRSPRQVPGYILGSSLALVGGWGEELGEGKTGKIFSRASSTFLG